MDGRKRHSGAQYKKIAQKKKRHFDEIVAKTGKLSKFFSKGTSGIEAAEESTGGIDVEGERIVESPAFLGDDSDGIRRGECSGELGCSTAIATVPIEAVTMNTVACPSVAEESQNDFSDPALWKVNESLRDHFSLHTMIQNDDGDYYKSKREYVDQNRFLTNSLFKKKLINGEVVKRCWLIYSKSTGRVYCAPCKLYGGTTALGTAGFNDWKNSNIINNHDNSEEHRQCLQKYLGRKNASQRIDSKLLSQYQEEVQYWRNVLHRVVEVVKFLSSRGLPFHGENEVLGSTSNGNFLGCIELLCKFDPFMADHVARFGNKGRGVPSYLSSTTVNEFILMLAQHVKTNIVEDIRNAKYFSMIVDSTPDVSNVDQLAFVVRYVAPDGSPVERFLTFIPNCGHKGEDMEQAVVSTLETLNLNMSDCRGQSYNNASNMSGCYKGLQNRIRQLNPHARYVPCAAHSLQLVGSAAAGSSQSSVEFFALEQQLYNFFHSSTKRWDILMSKCNKQSLTVKTLSKTRWSARADASKALCRSYQEIIAALQEIGSNEDETKETQLEARQILEKLQNLEVAIMICFWNEILTKFKEVSEKIQGQNLDIDRVTLLLETLDLFVLTLRDEEQFSKYEAKAKLMCGSETYKKDTQRKKKLKIPFGESKEGSTEFDGRKTFLINCYYSAIDTLKSHLVRRKAVYVELRELFSFLWTLDKIDKAHLKEKANHLLKEYSLDLEPSFPEECFQLKVFLQENNIFYQEEQAISKDTTKLKLGTKASRLLKYLKSTLEESLFPNVEVALRIFLSMAVTNCSGERSFSALGRVKNYLRSSLMQEKMNALALLFIESEYMEKVSFDQIVDSFATSKSRKKSFT